jgi:hypothetical protein
MRATDPAARSWIPKEFAESELEPLMKHGAAEPQPSTKSQISRKHQLKGGQRTCAGGRGRAALKSEGRHSLWPPFGKARQQAWARADDSGGGSILVAGGLGGGGRGSR